MMVDMMSVICGLVRAMLLKLGALPNFWVCDTGTLTGDLGLRFELRFFYLYPGVAHCGYRYKNLLKVSE